MAKFDYRREALEPAIQEGREPRLGRWFSEQPQMPYILPFFAYVLLMVPGSLGHLGGMDWEKLWKEYLPVVYPAKTVLAGLLLWYLWPWYTPIRWNRLGLGVMLGLAGTVLWIGSEYLCQRAGIAKPADAAAIYNPDIMLSNVWARRAFLCLRVAGPTLVVPVMEELFFRDFLMRALVMGVRFQAVPVGTFSWISLIGMSIAFGVNHGWIFFIPGFLYGLMAGILLIRTKSLGACIVAHGVTNWTLYLYVIFRGDWQFM